MTPSQTLQKAIFKPLKKRIQRWLDIKEAPAQPKTDKDDLQKVIKKLESELSFWKNTFRKYSRVPCAHCKKEMHVYPYGGAYYERNGQKVHAACYDDYLETQK